ncbi:MAG: spore cortex biosynthesis protein YabQ [Lachnospiraceae bacterium]|nr:spore cortex biosynthesis protein YabQ [Lachnospiraceae bacterium]
MSQNILIESRMLVHFFLLGMGITICYDGIRFLRLLIPHNNVFIAIEDVAFWIITGFVVFYMFLKESNGSIRFFSIGGAILGMVVKNKLTGNIKPSKIALCKRKNKAGGKAHERRDIQKKKAE